MRATPTGSGLISALGVVFFTTGFSSIMGVATITPGQVGLSAAGLSTGVMPDKGTLGGVDTRRLREEVEESRSILLWAWLIQCDHTHKQYGLINFYCRFIKWRHQRSPMYVSCIIIYNIPLLVYVVSVASKQ